jgi:radical SAM protein with 4Fe4S-binding SPASM domain
MAGCVLESVPFSGLQERLMVRALAERIPLSASVEIIATCNFNCQHCYIAPGAAREDVMSASDATYLFAQLTKAGVLDVLLTGGEVFTHRNFREIFLAAKRSGLGVHLNSNGYMIGKRWADFLADWPPQSVSISIYGLSNEAYEKVTRVPNAYGRVMQAVDLLIERGIKVDLKCPAMTITADMLPELQRIAAAKGASFRYDPIITPHEKGDAAPVQLQLAPRRVLELDEQLNPGLTDWAPEFQRAVSHANQGNVYYCGAGRLSLHVNVHGGVSTCVSSRQTVGNLFEESFDEVWARLGGKVAKRFPEGHPCGTCRFRTLCAGCPATVEQATGLPDGYVQQYCKITHLRAHRVGYHPTGVPRTVTEGIPAHVVTPRSSVARALPILS